MAGALFVGRYKKAPWRTEAMLILFVVYLLVPTDFISDFLPILGFVDDAAVFGASCWSLPKGSTAAASCSTSTCLSRTASRSRRTWTDFWSGGKKFEETQIRIETVAVFESDERFFTLFLI